MVDAMVGGKVAGGLGYHLFDCMVEGHCIRYGYNPNANPSPKPKPIRFARLTIGSHRPLCLLHSVLQPQCRVSGQFYCPLRHAAVPLVGGE